MARLLKSKEDEEKYGRNLDSGVMITCAITDKLNSSYGLLSLADFKTLSDRNQILVPDTCVVSNTNLLCLNKDSNNESQLVENRILNKIDDLAVEEGEKMNLEEVVLDCQVEKNEDFRNMQLDDISLNRCWKSLKLKDTEFFIDRNTQLLYRSKTMCGLKINQLVVPKCKREIVIRSAHDSKWSAHLGIDKTLKCMQSFYFWPDMYVDVVNHVKACSPYRRVFERAVRGILLGLRDTWINGEEQESRKAMQNILQNSKKI